MLSFSEVQKLDEYGRTFFFFMFFTFFDKNDMIKGAENQLLFSLYMIISFIMKPFTICSPLLYGLLYFCAVIMRISIFLFRYHAEFSVFYWLSLTVVLRQLYLFLLCSQKVYFLVKYSNELRVLPESFTTGDKSLSVDSLSLRKRRIS